MKKVFSVGSITTKTGSSYIMNTQLQRQEVRLKWACWIVVGLQGISPTYHTSERTGAIYVARFTQCLNVPTRNKISQDFDGWSVADCHRSTKWANAMFNKLSSHGLIEKRIGCGRHLGWLLVMDFICSKLNTKADLTTSLHDWNSVKNMRVDAGTQISWIVTSLKESLTCTRPSPTTTRMLISFLSILSHNMNYHPSTCVHTKKFKQKRWSWLTSRRRQSCCRSDCHQLRVPVILRSLVRGAQLIRVSCDIQVAWSTRK